MDNRPYWGGWDNRVYGSSRNLEFDFALTFAPSEKENRKLATLWPWIKTFDSLMPSIIQSHSSTISAVQQLSNESFNREKIMYSKPSADFLIGSNSFTIIVYRVKTRPQEARSWFLSYFFNGYRIKHGASIQENRKLLHGCELKLSTRWCLQSHCSTVSAMQQFSMAMALYFLPRGIARGSESLMNLS